MHGTLKGGFKAEHALQVKKQSRNELREDLARLPIQQREVGSFWLA